jgi:hypothetical protein
MITSLGRASFKALAIKTTTKEAAVIQITSILVVRAPLSLSIAVALL